MGGAGVGDADEGADTGGTGAGDDNGGTDVGGADTRDDVGGTNAGVDAAGVDAAGVIAGGTDEVGVDAGGGSTIHTQDVPARVGIVTANMPLGANVIRADGVYNTHFLQ
jgi:hypothetical protein